MKLTYFLVCNPFGINVLDNIRPGIAVKIQPDFLNANLTQVMFCQIFSYKFNFS